MKNIIITIGLILCLFFIAGCSPDIENSSVQSSDDMESIEDSATEDDLSEDSTEEQSPEEERTAEENQALIEQLMQEKGLNATEIEDEETEEEETGPGNYTIELINMRGEPEKNLEISVGDSVTWISRQPNYVHRIQIREKLDNGAFDQTLLDPAESLKEDEEFTYTFDESGRFQWYSKTNYPTTSGYINVTG